MILSQELIIKIGMELFNRESATYGAPHKQTAVSRYWTDNPAWCFNDLITNKRYGLGKYVDTSTLDKWTLYEIGRYCDELVEDYDNG